MCDDGKRDCHMSIANFAELLAPFDPEVFFRDYYGRKPLHIRGGAEKFRQVMSWSILERLVNCTTLWTTANLRLILDSQVLPASAFCVAAKGRDTLADVLRPSAPLVNDWLAKGASLVLNDIDALTPGLVSVAQVLEDTLDTKVQANLYCSWKAHKAFLSHMDTHDVFAVHVEGRKQWLVYEGRAEHPINHPMFKGVPQEVIDKAKGKVLMDIVMEPGDLLYIPRGQYHDALAESGGTVHIAFGATSVIGIDIVTALIEAAVHDPLLRANLPRRAEGEDALAAHLEQLAKRLQGIMCQESFTQAVAGLQRAYRYPREGVVLPISRFSADWRLTGPDFTVEEGAGGPLLKGPKGAVPIPPPAMAPVAWIVRNAPFREADLEAAFPALGKGPLGQILAQLQQMKVLTKI